MAQDIGKPVFDLILLVASGAGFIMSSQLPDVVVLGDLSPAFFPQLISALVFICAVPCLIRDTREWLAMRRVPAASSASGKRPLLKNASTLKEMTPPEVPQGASPPDGQSMSTRPVKGRRNTFQWLFVVAASLGYVVMFEPLGYIISTTLFCLFCVIGLWWIGGSTRGMTAPVIFKSVAGYVIYALVLAVAIQFVFTRLFNIPLPG